MVSFKNIAVAALAASSTTDAFSFSFSNQYWDKAVTIFKNPTSLIPQSSNTRLYANTKPVPGDSPIEVCDFTESQLLVLNQVDLAPNPPEAGSNLTFTAVGTIDETIKDGAYVEVEVRYGFIKLIHQTYDLCEEITKVDLECPIKKGEHVITKVVEIPEEVPPGRYLVTARAYTKDDEYITCLTATIVFPVE
ncbi:Phosphatidylglycerol/phosphatidylinositol transfer protein [Candida viswanathii]|uniref:Phosphatidylglycerol/phosphatidylinositol transfer protein n=1 Tax=Candida viswanathii TaxID=5486 RepID=A0A367YJZ2_9ASCO|nr:Phosphatidylglycerol/phosphatidylinositol transfer protein [Candida viswanathii]RCK66215.1 Phosphatidylglycerol/phosphatidylinositol transfer protein [Candida viswanathii]